MRIYPELKFVRLLLGVLVAMAVSVCSFAQDGRPNILLIVVDDMGFTDLGSFGGEIETPNLDELALNGIRLTNFQAASTCSVTRSMLMTGVDSHIAGLGNMLEELSPNQKGQPGYEGHMNDRVVSVATLLRDVGYHTYLSGKWHLGNTDETSPSARGFEKSFSLLSGGASHYADMRPSYAPTPDAKAKYREDDRMLDSLPDNFEYSSQFFVDRMIRYLEADRDSGNPFFAYLSFTAPHWPLQAPVEAMEKYRGRYDEGWDVLRIQRLVRQRDLGLIPADVSENPPPPKAVPWDDLDPEQMLMERRAMEIYAAMIDEVDVHTGRLLDYLKSAGEFDNTLIVFMSDNGAEGHDLDETWPREYFPKIRKVIDETNDFSYENMGKPGSYTLYGPNWARASSPALRLHKAFPTEGGTRVAAFVHHPNFATGGSINDTLLSVEDVTPTLLDLAGIDHPGAEYNGRPVARIAGISFLPLLADDADVSPYNERVIARELFGKRSVRRGDWKVVNMPDPWGDGEWHLYNVSVDLGEKQDLAMQEPGILAGLVDEWDIYARDKGVILPDWVSGY